MNTKNYWLVGANWDGNDQAEIFYRRGCWEMGYGDDEKPTLTKRRNEIHAGDRIALKSMDGKGATTITIKAIGVVTDMADKKVFIDWKLTNLNRTVQSHGAFATIHGPYSFSDSWTKEVFCL